MKKARFKKQEKTKIKQSNPKQPKSKIKNEINTRSKKERISLIFQN